jgi:hypothetical protein
MKMPRIRIVLAILGGSLVAAAAWSQQTPVVGDAAQPSAVPALAAPIPDDNPFFLAPPSKVDQALRRLRDADELHKPDLIKELEAAVSAEFDEDMKHREAELTKLEERMAKLRTQLERRKKAKAEITQLQTKVIVNEAEGLGFSNAWSAEVNDGRDTPAPAPRYPSAGTPEQPNLFTIPRYAVPPR